MHKKPLHKPPEPGTRPVGITALFPTILQPPSGVTLTLPSTHLAPPSHTSFPPWVGIPPTLSCKFGTNISPGPYPLAPTTIQPDAKFCNAPAPSWGQSGCWAAAVSTRTQQSHQWAQLQPPLPGQPPAQALCVACAHPISASPSNSSPHTETTMRLLAYMALNTSSVSTLRQVFRVIRRADLVRRLGNHDFSPEGACHAVQSL